MRGPDVERLRRVVVLVDGAAVRARKLAGAGDDGLEHRLDVERRADGPADLAQGRQLLNRLGQLARARLELLEEADVLNGDDGLVGEGLQECDLRGRETARGCSRDHDRADHLRLPKHRHAQSPAPAPNPCGVLVPILRVSHHVFEVDDRAAADRPRARRFGIKRHGESAPRGLGALGCQAVNRGQLQMIASEHRNNAELRVTQLDGVLGDHVEHRPHIGRRGADRLEDLARGRLLLQRLGEVAVTSLQLVEQAHVLDRDHRLIGEGLEEGDLRVRERDRL